MSYQAPFNSFSFDSYEYIRDENIARFHYSFDKKLTFTEEVRFSGVEKSVNEAVLSRALELAFFIAGVSYYKTFPTKKVTFKTCRPTPSVSKFLQLVYTKGLSQFLFENRLTAEDVVVFETEGVDSNVLDYNGDGILTLQSGGKDSLLLATMLEEKGESYEALYVSSASSYPEVLKNLQSAPRVIQRSIDTSALAHALELGGLNGHVPVTYIVESYALIDAILHNENQVLASIGTEGEEPHSHIGALAVNHQWSKTWEAEQLMADIVSIHVSPTLKIGSPLRGYSELKIAELFAEKCWTRFGDQFSSCNRANYKQHADNSRLTWCGDCPKCANSFLLFAPFVDPELLKARFGGVDLLAKESLKDIFKGLLGIDGVMKPFECVGEIAELRLAYHMAKTKHPAYKLPFDVPKSTFDYDTTGVAQSWASALIR